MSHVSISEKSESDRKGDSLRKFVGALFLVSSILGGSSIGVMNNYIPVESPFAKNAWRNGLVCVYFVIPAIIENYYVSTPIRITLESYLRILVTLWM
jgi:hypothetical protein